MRNTTLFASIALFAAACGGNPCEEYVDYLCDCTATSEACDDLKTTYENAEADLQDECSAALDEAEAAAKTCEEGGGDDTATAG